MGNHNPLNYKVLIVSIMRFDVYFFILFMGLFSCDDKPLHLFQTYESPDGKFELSVFYTDPPIYGPHDICFKVYNQHTKLKIEKDCYELNNDGANLSDTNIQVEWLDSFTAQVILNGQQQEADTLILKMN